MKLERIVLLVASLVIIGAFFLPYLTLKTPLGAAEVSGLSLVQTGLDIAQVAEKPGGDILMDFVAKYWEKAADTKDLGALLAVLLVSLGPVFFGLFALGYLVRALIGKQYKRGIFFTLLFTAASWAVFHYLGNSYGFEENFFKMAGVGFWMAFGGMLAAAFSLFFAKDI